VLWVPVHRDTPGSRRDLANPFAVYLHLLTAMRHSGQRPVPLPGPDDGKARLAIDVTPRP
jgi:hypothetical protein